MNGLGGLLTRLTTCMWSGHKLTAYGGGEEECLNCGKWMPTT